MKKTVFLERYLALRLLSFVAYVMVVFSIASYANRDYLSFLEKKSVRMEALTYKISFDLANIFDGTEMTLNDIGEKIVKSNGSKAQIGKILIEAELLNSGKFAVSQLSTGNFYWIDAKNNLAATSEGVVVNEINLSGRDYLRKTSKTFGRIFTGEAIVGAASGQYAIPLGVGVADKNGKYLGTLVASFRMSELLKRYSQLVDPLMANFIIFDLSNNIFLTSEINFFSHDSALEEELRDIEIKSSDPLIIKSDIFHRKINYALLRSFEKYPYKILVGYKNNELKSELMSELLPWLVQFLFVTMFFAFVMVLLRRR